MKISGILVAVLSIPAIYSSSHLRNWPDNENTHALSNAQASVGSIDYPRNPEDFYESIPRTKTENSIYENWLLRNRNAAQQNVNEKRPLRSEISEPRTVAFDNSYLPQKIPLTQFNLEEHDLQHGTFYPNRGNVETFIGSAERESESIPLRSNEDSNYEAVAASASNSLSQKNQVIHLEVTGQDRRNIKTQEIVANPIRRKLTVNTRPEILNENRNLNTIAEQAVQRVLSQLQPKKRYAVIYPNGTIVHMDDVKEIVKNHPNHVVINPNINTTTLSTKKKFNFNLEPTPSDGKYHVSKNNSLKNESISQISHRENSIITHNEVNKPYNNLSINYNADNISQSNENKFYSHELPILHNDNESLQNADKIQTGNHTKITIQIKRKSESQLPLLSDTKNSANSSLIDFNKNVTNSVQSPENFSSETHTSEDNATLENLPNFDHKSSYSNSSEADVQYTNAPDLDSLDEIESKQITSTSENTGDLKSESIEAKYTSSEEETMSTEVINGKNTDCTTVPYRILDSNESKHKEYVSDKKESGINENQNEESGKVTYQDGNQWKQVSLEGKVFDILHSFDVPLVPITISDAKGKAHSCLRMAYSASPLAYIICSNKEKSNS